MLLRPSQVSMRGASATIGLKETLPTHRLTSSFAYVGPLAMPEVKPSRQSGVGFAGVHLLREELAARRE